MDRLLEKDLVYGLDRCGVCFDAEDGVSCSIVNHVLFEEKILLRCRQLVIMRLCGKLREEELSLMLSLSKLFDSLLSFEQIILGFSMVYESFQA